MERAKIENFAKTHPEEPFPWFRSLTDEECQELRECIATRLSLPKGVSPLDLARAVHSTAAIIRDADATAAGFDVAALIHVQGIAPHAHIKINWYRFDRVDVMLFDDLVRYFDDIWYPGPDDIDLFDNSLEWMMEIMHNGQVSNLGLGSR